MLQLRAVDQKGVVHPLSQGGDFGQLHLHLVARQHQRNRIQQAGAVAGRDVEQPVLRLLVRAQGDARRNRKAFDPARHPAFGRLGQRPGCSDGQRQLGLQHAGQGLVMLFHAGRCDHLKGI